MQKIKTIEFSEEENQEIVSSLTAQMLPLTNGKTYKQVEKAVDQLLRCIKDSIKISLEFQPK